MIRLTIYSLVSSTLVLLASMSLAEDTWAPAFGPYSVFPGAVYERNFKMSARLMMRDPVSGDKREYKDTLLDCCISDPTANGCMMDEEERRVSGCYFDLEIDLVNNSESTYQIMDIRSDNPDDLVMLPSGNQGFAKREVEGITVMPGRTETVRLNFDIKNRQCGNDWDIENSSLDECPNRHQELFNVRIRGKKIKEFPTMGFNVSCLRFRYYLDKKEKQPNLPATTKIKSWLHIKDVGICP